MNRDLAGLFDQFQYLAPPAFRQQSRIVGVRHRGKGKSIRRPLNGQILPFADHLSSYDLFPIALSFLVFLLADCFFFVIQVPSCLN
jgi:hypothetical protein